MKKIMIIAALMVATLGASAQGMFIKPMAGGLLTNWTGDNKDFKMKVGFTGGVELGYQFNDVFALTAGALYSMQGARTKDYNTNINYNLDYLNVPVMLNVYVAPGFALKAGGQLGFLLKAKGGDHDYKDYCEKKEYSIPVGLSYEFDDVVLDARYNFSLSDVNKGNFSNFVPNGTIRNSVIMLTIGYRIPM